MGESVSLYMNSRIQSDKKHWIICPNSRSSQQAVAKHHWILHALYSSVDLTQLTLPMPTHAAKKCCRDIMHKLEPQSNPKTLALYGQLFPWASIKWLHTLHSGSQTVPEHQCSASRSLGFLQVLHWVGKALQDLLRQGINNLRSAYVVGKVVNPTNTATAYCVMIMITKTAATALMTIGLQKQ